MGMWIKIWHSLRLLLKITFANSNLDFATCYYFVKYYIIICQTVLFPWLLTYFSFSFWSTGRKVSQVRGTLDKTCTHCTIQRRNKSGFEVRRRDAPILVRSKVSSKVWSIIENDRFKKTYTQVWNFIKHPALKSGQK